MFTGIIKEIGTITGIRYGSGSGELSVEAPGLSETAKIGDSISINGICLTVTKKEKKNLHFDCLHETLKKTTLGCIKKRDKVNLEPALELKQGLSGHMVSGHIDEIGRIKSIRKLTRESIELEIGVSSKGETLLVYKGSVSLDGISLTVNKVRKYLFTVNIIPHTYKTTILHLKKAGNRVNIEYDMAGKYILKGLSNKQSSITKTFLTNHGFSS